MNIDLGYLGKVVLEEIPNHYPEKMYDYPFVVVMDGYTESGIRVHGVVDRTKFATYPAVWNNAILIKVN